MRLALTRVLALAFVAATAHADDTPNIVLEVGKSTERDVAIATGWFCDDASLVRADMITRGDHNIWVVTGVKEGQTQCRDHVAVPRGGRAQSLSLGNHARKHTPTQSGIVCHQGASA